MMVRAAWYKFSWTSWPRPITHLFCASFFPFFSLSTPPLLGIFFPKTTSFWDLGITLSRRGKATSREGVLGGGSPHEKKEIPSSWRAKKGGLKDRGKRKTPWAPLGWELPTVWKSAVSPQNRVFTDVGFVSRTLKST